MKTYIKRLLITTSLTLAISAPFCQGMEEQINLAIQSLFDSMGRAKAMELGIVAKEESVSHLLSLEEKKKRKKEELQKRMREADEACFREQEVTRKCLIEMRLKQVSPFKPYWIDQDPEFGNTYESTFQKINTREIVTGKGWTLLHIAVHYGEISIVYGCLIRGALIVPSLDGIFPDQVAMSPTAHKYSFWRAQKQIQKRTNYGHHALKNYTWPENFDVLANPNAREISSGNGYTPLHTATLHNDLVFVKYLLANGATIEKDQSGKYPHELDILTNAIPQEDQKDCRRLVTEAYLKTMMFEDGTVYSPHLKTFWTTPSETFQTIKVTGDLTDIELYDLMMQPTLLKNVDVSACTSLSQRARSILALMFNQSEKDWRPDPINRNPINDREAAAIGKALCMNTTTTRLYLQSQKIDDTVAIEIGKALRINKTLEVLYLNQNNIGDRGGAEIGQALPFNTTLKYLCIHSNHISTLGASEIGKGLALNKGLTDTLHFYDNHVDDQGVIPIAKALETNITLTVLLLYKNQIGDIGAIKIAKAIAHNPTLIEINLSANKIADRGACELANALITNTIIKKFFLQNNRIGNEGAIAFSQALSSNSILKAICLSMNEIGEAGIEALTKSAKNGLNISLASQFYHG